MDAMILLVLLTLKGSGPMGVNFVEFRDVPSCEARAEQLTGVLAGAGIKVVESPCVMGIQHFTPHRHRQRKGDRSKGAPGKGAPKKKFTYLLALDNQRALAIPKHDMQACEQERQRLETKIDERARSNGVRYYCAVSEQMLIDDRDNEAMQRRKQREAWMRAQQQGKVGRAGNDGWPGTADNR